MLLHKLRLVVFSAFVAAVVANISDDLWDAVHKELSVCSALTGFCKRALGDGQVAFHPVWDNMEMCEHHGGKWHHRFDTSGDLKTACNTHLESADPTEKHVFVIRLSHGIRLNSHLRKAHKDFLGDMDEIIPCQKKHYLFTRLTVAQALDSAAQSIGDVFALPPEAKVGPILLAARESPDQQDPDAEVQLIVNLAPGMIYEVQGQEQQFASQWEGKLTALSGVTQCKVEPSGPDRLLLSGIIRSQVDLIIDALTASGDVLQVDAPLKFKAFNRDAQALSQSGAPNERRIWSKGIRGQGQVAAVADTGIDVASCFFEDPNVPVVFDANGRFENLNHRKVVQYIAGIADTTDTDGHGTHVSGTVCGQTDISNNNQDEFSGMAPDAKVAFFDIGRDGEQFLSVPGNIFGTMFPEGQRVGARVQSNSWGAAVNAYDNNARDVDRFMFQNQDFLILVAAGNDGAEGPGSLGTPATSKNCVSVGSSENLQEFFDQFANGNCQNGGNARCEENLSGFSSRGPRFDNAFAPDVTAPGQFLLSAGLTAPGNTCPRAFLAGTSMATPVTAGSAVLIRQYFLEGFYPSGQANPADAFTPSGALVKAILVNGAKVLTGFAGNVPVDQNIPNNDQGFGRIQLDSVLTFDDQSDGLTLLVQGDVDAQPSIDDGDAPQTFEVLTDSTILQPFKATLTWTEPQGSLFTNNRLLINDLDLTVRCQGCSDSSTKAANQADFPGTDTINNIEQVVIPAGDVEPNQVYTVTVSAANVPLGPQNFAIVVTGSFSVDVQPPPPDPSNSAAPSRTAAPSGTPTPSAAPSETPSVTPSITRPSDPPSSSPSLSLGASPSVTPTLSESSSASPSLTASHSASQSITASSSPSAAPSGLDDGEDTIAGLEPGVFIGVAAAATFSAAVVLMCVCNRMKYGSWTLCECLCPTNKPPNYTRQTAPVAVSTRHQASIQPSITAAQLASSNQRPVAGVPEWNNTSNQIAGGSMANRVSRRMGDAANRMSVRVAPPLPPRAPQRRQDQWSEHFDPNSGQKYYFNVWTGESSWTDPRVAPTV